MWETDFQQARWWCKETHRNTPHHTEKKNSEHRNPPSNLYITYTGKGENKRNEKNKGKKKNKKILRCSNSRYAKWNRLISVPSMLLKNLLIFSSSKAQKFDGASTWHLRKMDNKSKIHSSTAYLQEWIIGVEWTMEYLLWMPLETIRPMITNPTSHLLRIAQILKSRFYNFKAP